MGEHRLRLGPYPCGHAMEDVFLDPDRGPITYDPCSAQDDARLGERVIVDALKFANNALGR